jgi:hypothetical protein
MKTILLPFVLFILLTGKSIFSQDERESREGGTPYYETNQYEYSPIPADNSSSINPNKETRVVNTPVGTFLIYPNFMVYPNPNTYQAEVIITRNKQFPNIMLASSITFWPIGNTTTRNAGIYVSTNGGLNWNGRDTLNTGSPILPLNDPSPVIDKNGRFIITNTLFSGGTYQGLTSNYSTNYGLSWSIPQILMSGNTPDKNMTCTDDITTSPYYGRTYTGWWLIGIRYTVFSYTTNGGESWSSPIQINNPPAGYKSFGCDLRTGVNGEVYVVWPATVISSSGVEDYYGFAKSTDGGVSFTTNEYIFDVNGIAGLLPAKGNIRVFSHPRIDVDKTGGPRNGWIYVVGCDKNLSPAGSDPDIILHRSTDGGSTWSQGIRVNQDPLNNGALQYFPAITVDDFGGINVVYYDDRNVLSNLVQVYGSRSTDGGNTWGDFQISDHSFAPAWLTPQFTGGFMGDYIGICYSNGKIWPIWTDNFSGHCQAWTTGVDIITSVEPVSNNIPVEYSLSQNYPNPFNPVTMIKFDIPSNINNESFLIIKMIIFDILGDEVATLVNKQLKPGTYEVKWDASSCPSGVYFYKITAGDYNETKKMILIK